MERYTLYVRAEQGDDISDTINNMSGDFKCCLVFTLAKNGHLGIITKLTYDDCNAQIINGAVMGDHKNIINYIWHRLPLILKRDAVVLSVCTSSVSVIKHMMGLGAEYNFDKCLEQICNMYHFSTEKALFFMSLGGRLPPREDVKVSMKIYDLWVRTHQAAIMIQRWFRRRPRSLKYLMVKQLKNNCFDCNQHLIPDDVKDLF